MLTLAHIRERCIEDGDCLVWDRALTGAGYPVMTYGGKRNLSVRKEVRQRFRRTGSPGAGRTGVPPASDSASLFCKLSLPSPVYRAY